MNELKRIRAVASIEFRLALRNRWVLLATTGLLLFALALGFLSAGLSEQTRSDALSITAGSLATLSVYLIPLIALILSYDTMTGEVERGTLALVLATPVSRWELVLGKFLSHISVLAIAILVGYGIAGIAIAAVHGYQMEGVWAWVRLAWTCLLLGAVFSGLGMLVSVRTAKTGTAAAIVIGIWLLLVVLYDVALLASLVADKGGFFTKVLFPYFVVANPGDAFRLFNLAMLEAAAPVAGIDGLARTMPFAPWFAIGVLFLWLGVLAGAALSAVRKLQP